MAHISVQTTGRSTSLARRTPPGPRGHFLFGILPEFRRDPLRLFQDLAREYGDVVLMRFGPSQSYFIHHPDGIKRILQDNNRNYKRNQFVNGIIKLVSGENLFTSDGEEWLKRRRFMQPAFHRQRIASFGTIMTDTALEMLERWRGPADRQLDIQREMMRVTLSVVGKALFSIDLSQEAATFGGAFDINTAFINYRLNTLFSPPLFLPTRRNREFRKATQTVNQMIDGIIHSRRAQKQDTGDLLSMLMQAQDEETGLGLTDEQLRNEVATFVFAGHETTANTLTWAFYLLSQQAEAERELHAEVDQVLGQRTATVEDLPNLKYTRMVIEETQRLYPPAWAMSRQSIGEDEICGYIIPANAGISLVPFVTHRDPRFWDHPEQFDPQRFTPERSAGRPHFAYLPFGGGPRLCIGNVFAMTEAQLILATVAQHYRLRLVPGSVVEPWPIFTLKTRYGLPMTIEAR